MWHKIVHQDDRYILDQISQKPQADKNAHILRYIHKKGHIVWIELQVSYLDLESSSGKRVQGIARDISDQKQREELKRHVENLAQSNKELENFAYAASHDLQEPLNTIRNYLSLFEKNAGVEFNDTAQTFFGFIDGAVNRMSNLIKALLDYSRISRPGYKTEEIDVREELELTLDDLGELLNGDDISLKTGKMPKIIAIKPLFRGIFQNLIVNAVKFRKKKAR